MAAQRGSLSFGIVEPTTQAPLGVGSLRESVVPSTRAETYGRQWILTRYRELEGGLIYGRIGIVSSVDPWDPNLEDFRDGQLEAGHATPYLLDPEKARLVFQSRGSLIKPQSFVNAFQHLLNAASPGDAWRVRLAEREMSWETFTQLVDRIEVMTIRLEQPNPRFRNRLAQELVDTTRSASATVTLRGEDIDDDSAVVEQLMEHAEAYGSTNARGIANQARVWFRSKRRAAQVSADVPADPENGDVQPPEMLDQMDRWNEIDYFTGDPD